MCVDIPQPYSRDEPMISQRELDEIVQHWGRTTGAIRHFKTVDNNARVFVVATEQGQEFVLKQAGRVDRIAQLASHARVLQHLDAARVPVALPLISDQQQLFVPYGDALYTLSSMLARERDEAAVWPSAPLYSNIGRAIGRLHRALADYPDEIVSWQMKFARRALDEARPLVQAHLNAHRRAHFEDVLEQIESEMRSTLAGLPEQYIHGDCHGGNVLLYHGDVSGFIDLDHLPRGPRIYDVSYFLADRVKAHFDAPDALALWLQHFAQLIRGYESVQPMTAAEKRAIWYGMLAVQLLFAQWFFTQGAEAAAERNLAVFEWIYEQRDTIEGQLSTGEQGVI
jgi:Ser/Thr protein kinase RdoA (MazF antagonist)